MGQIAGKLAVSTAALAMATAAGLTSPFAGGAGEAAAQPRQGAPIVYAGPSGTQAETRAPVQPAAAPSPAQAPTRPSVPTAPAQPTDRSTARIAFIYPTAQADTPVAPVVDRPAVPEPSAPITLAAASLVSATPLPAPKAPDTRPASPAAEVLPGADERIRPAAGPVFDQVGLASWYGEAFHGRPTANGETFDMNAMSAAHPSLPLPSLIQVVNLANDKEVVVRVNDRGPFIEGRILDLSKGAAEVLDFIDEGETRVRIRYLGPAPVGGGTAPVAGAQEPVSMLDDETGMALQDVAAPAPLTAPAVTRAPAPSVDPRPAATDDRAAAAPSDAVFVQLGAFSSISNAERLKTTLSASLPVSVQPVRVNGADFFRVLVGPWADARKAEAVKADLAARNYGTGMIVSGF